MEFSNAALCREKQEGGVMQTRARRRPELLRPPLLPPVLTFTAGALCQGFSVAVQRAHAALDNVVISRVMGCVIRQPPVRSIKEWHQFIPARVLQPSRNGAWHRHRCCQPPWEQGAGLGAGLPGLGLLSHSSDFSL